MFNCEHLGIGIFRFTSLDPPREWVTSSSQHPLEDELVVLYLLCFMFAILLLGLI